MSNQAQIDFQAQLVLQELFTIQDALEISDGDMPRILEAILEIVQEARESFPDDGSLNEQGTGSPVQGKTH